jgi:rSAM/selenodomain-associated transferase 1
MTASHGPGGAGRVTIAILAKAPVAGRVKTRLCPPYTADQAAELAAAALRDTLAVVRRTPSTKPAVLVLAGDSSRFRRSGVEVLAQRGDGLDERIGYAMADVHRERGGPVLLIGMDTPQVTVRALAWAAGRLAAGVDSVLGPAADGGYWAIGLQRPDPSLVLGVPMSTAATGRHQHERLRAAGLHVEVLPMLVDVDDAESAHLVARSAPTTAFARVLAGMAPGIPA